MIQTNLTSTSNMFTIARLLNQINKYLASKHRFSVVQKSDFRVNLLIWK